MTPSWDVLVQIRVWESVGLERLGALERFAQLLTVASVFGAARGADRLAPRGPIQR
jgi:hypothetical protein